MKEKRTDWLGILKSFLAPGIPEDEEKDSKKIILDSNAVSQDVKEELFKTLDSRERDSKAFREEYRALRVDKAVNKKQVRNAVKKALDEKDKDSKGREPLD